MKPIDIQAIGTELAIKWEDSAETYIPLEKLRKSCPCAGCKGEVDVMGNLHKGPVKPLTPRAFQLVNITVVGGYAVQPSWGDGHASGLYPFDYLQKLGKSS